MEISSRLWAYSEIDTLSSPKEIRRKIRMTAEILILTSL
ncbi:hypothetical protein L21SP2_2832 [Salinispira pacifica]|uniref:Uncharacterized protein n=1 Tax=Salinispira pacifica TaxID=1307761 RepID=V5WK42_9SPIO|nr:hypothetical protein L21SP2_2832 [Salinispira pacifica]